MQSCAFVSGRDMRQPMGRLNAELLENLHCGILRRPFAQEIFMSLSMYQASIPNFFFHYTTAYAILRHLGVAIGKVDYVAGRTA